MAIANDNPIRIARLAAGLPQARLAREAGLARPSLVAIEEGTTREPSGETLDALAAVLGANAKALATQLAEWHAKRPEPTLTNRQRAILALSPQEVTATYPTFRDWRSEFGTRNKFSSALGLNGAVVSRYESGIREKGMPDTLQSAILTRLNVTPEYLVALAGLEPAEES